MFEVFDTHPENNRSMFGGGRYDGLVGLFGVEPVPTVGFGMGDVTLQNFLESHNLLPELKPHIDAYVVLAGDVYEKAVPVLQKFREFGLNLAVDTSGRKLDKQLKTATKKNIRYAIIIGDMEIEDGHYGLKDLQTGTEEKHGIERMVSLVKDHRHENKDSDSD